MTNGRYVLALLFVNDILVLSELASDRERVQQILERQYEKVTVSEGTCLPYLGIMIVKTNNGYEICMKVYIEETIKLYGKVLKEYVTPATQNLFSVNPDSKKCVDSVKFHSVVAKVVVSREERTPGYTHGGTILVYQSKGVNFGRREETTRILDAEAVRMPSHVRKYPSP